MLCTKPNCNCLKAEALRRGVPEDQIKYSYPCLSSSIEKNELKKNYTRGDINPTEGLPESAPIAPVLVMIHDLSDKDLLNVCREMNERIKSSNLEELFKRFQNYARVQSLFYKLSKRE